MYDSNRNLTGETIFRNDIIPQNKYITIVVAFIQNLNGKFLIQKRSKQKGGKFAPTGGHPESGEKSVYAMCREINEELGLIISENELKLIYSGRDDSLQIFYDIYYIKKDLNIKDLILQKEEVEFVEWDSIEQIENLIKNNLFFHINDFEKILNILK